MNADRLVRAYRSSNRRRRQLLTLANGCFDGLWLGLLDREAFARLDEYYFTNAHEVMDGRTFAYADEKYNLSGLFDWESAAVDEHFPPGGRVVVTGAGGGREVVGLLERGFDAIGFEPNAVLAAAGAALLEARGHPLRLHACERDVFPLETGACDAVIVGWGAYMHIPGRRSRIAFLRSARRSMTDGAPMLCSFYVRQPGARYDAIVARIANVVRRIRRGERVDVGDAVTASYFHRFTRADIAAELEAGGFRMIAFASEPYAHAVAVAAPMPR